jgi:hypothetical protein
VQLSQVYYVLEPLQECYESLHYLREPRKEASRCRRARKRWRSRRCGRSDTLPPLLCLAASVTEVPRTLTERSTTVIATTLANRFVFIFFSIPLSIQCATLRLLPFGTGLAQRNVDGGYKPRVRRGATFDPAEESPEIDTIRRNFRSRKSQCLPVLVHLSKLLVIHPPSDSKGSNLLNAQQRTFPRG